MATPDPGFTNPTKTEVIHPWSPRATLWNAILLGPIAAGLVAYLNLKRLGAESKALKVLVGSVVGTLALLVITIKTNLIPSWADIALSIGIGSVFSTLQQPEFNRWKAANPDVELRSGWSTVGWGLLGAGLFIVIDVALVLVFAH